MAIKNYISKGQAQISSAGSPNFHMIEYCETFKMAFSKILDLMRRPKIVIESFFSYPILNFADTLTTVRRGKH